MRWSLWSIIFANLQGSPHFATHLNCVDNGFSLSTLASIERAEAGRLHANIEQITGILMCVCVQMDLQMLLVWLLLKSFALDRSSHCALRMWSEKLIIFVRLVRAVLRISWISARIWVYSKEDPAIQWNLPKMREPTHHLRCCAIMLNILLVCPICNKFLFLLCCSVAVVAYYICGITCDRKLSYIIPLRDRVRLCMCLCCTHIVNTN